MRRRPLTLFAAGVAVVASLVGSALPSTAAQSPATIYPPGFFSVAYSDTLYRGDSEHLHAATYAEWAAHGFPTPTRIGATYQREPWSDTIWVTPTPPGKWRTT